MAVIDPNRMRVETGGGGLKRAVLRIGGAEAHVYLHGAHVTHFAIEGQPPILFLSKESQFVEGKAIRGGVPICFPWFGPRNPDPSGGSPMHGFARVLPWKPLEVSATADRSSISLRLSDGELTRGWWPHSFAARYDVTLWADRLTLALKVTNLDQTPITFEEALHSYFAIAKAQNVSIEGLDGVEYLDKTDNLARKRQSGPVTISSETDRVYLGTRAPCLIRDAWNNRVIVNTKENSDATVVWNPWVAKAKAMADFGDEEWEEMVCVETCNVAAHAVTLEPAGRAKSSHSMSATIHVQGL
jgi:D-hexose-6-phosphate mutarotase